MKKVYKLEPAKLGYFERCNLNTGVIRGRYVLLFWTSNTEFAEKRHILTRNLALCNNISNVNKRIRR
jgi:hypothetical protein